MGPYVGTSLVCGWLSLSLSIMAREITLADWVANITQRSKGKWEPSRDKEMALLRQVAAGETEGIRWV